MNKVAYCLPSFLEQDEMLVLKTSKSKKGKESVLTCLKEKKKKRKRISHCPPAIHRCPRCRAFSHVPGPTPLGTHALQPLPLCPLSIISLFPWQPGQGSLLSERPGWETLRIWGAGGAFPRYCWLCCLQGAKVAALSSASAPLQSEGTATWFLCFLFQSSSPGKQI